MLRHLQIGLGLLLSAIGLFLSSWIVIPAPTFQLLPLAVGAPEISPWLLGCNLILVLLALSSRRRLARIALGCSLVALSISALPLLQLPAALQRAETVMQQNLGRDYLNRISTALQSQMQPYPFSLSTTLLGYPQFMIRSERVQFAAPDGIPLWLEVYHPLTQDIHPAIITIYGGAWQQGNPADHAAFNRYMANQGYTVVAIDYRHAPAYRFPSQVEDVQTALRFIQQQAASYKIDLTRMAIMGWSAGAHLAMLAAYQPKQPEQAALPALKAVVNYYGPTDLIQGYNDLPKPDPINIRDVLIKFIGGTPEQFQAQYQLASPVYLVTSSASRQTHDSKTLPPTLLIYGNRDHIVKPKFGQQLQEQLHAVGAIAVMIDIPWAEHAFDAIFNGLSNQLALYHTERFLAWALRSEAE